MNNSLSFRKESIQRSSSESMSLGRSLAGLVQDQGPRQPRDPQRPAITTILTITQ
ncbi:MAG: hypothetical protein IPP78_08685 [Holophagaceae bacterium]|nr:hypothetical protein [Holophagaceae bacterium]